MVGVCVDFGDGEGGWVEPVSAINDEILGREFEDEGLIRERGRKRLVS